MTREDEIRQDRDRLIGRVSDLETAHALERASLAEIAALKARSKCRTLVVQHFPDNSPDYAECGSVAYAGPDVAAAIVEAFGLWHRGSVVRISLWRNGSCADRWERVDIDGLPTRFQHFTLSLQANARPPHTVWTTHGVLRSQLDLEAELRDQ